MKPTAIVFAYTSIAAALLIVSTTAPAAAKVTSLNTSMSPGALHGSCNNAGGTYGAAGDGAGICMGKNGDYVICETNKHCTLNTARAALPAPKGNAASTVFDLQGSRRHDLPPASGGQHPKADLGAAIHARPVGPAAFSAKLSD
ncbi:MAG: hypothetical protein ABI398_10295 [Devosia sp.]